MSNFGFDLSQIIQNDDAESLEEYCEDNNSVDVIFPKPNNPKNPELFINQPSLLSAACYFKSYRCVVYLITQGADIHLQDKKKRTPFLFSVAGGSLQILQFLIENGACIMETDNDGNSALHYAVKYNQRALILYLCYGLGINMTISNKKKETPLHFAATDMKTDIIRLLIAHGADVNAKTIVCFSLVDFKITDFLQLSIFNNTHLIF